MKSMLIKVSFLVPSYHKEEQMIFKLTSYRETYSCATDQKVEKTIGISQYISY